ncbi:MAG: DUF2779 domain-containing protein, partial [Nanoarchaeota archaeon]|nr:DUF2779 domain-containing protein [Nanoarchaeota archaeon]
KLYRAGKKAFDLFESGIHEIHKIPEDYKLSEHQQIQKDCAVSGKPFIAKEAIKHFLKTLKYPLYYLDFETYNTAVPLYDGVKPYQQIPFQFSLHIVDSEKTKSKHVSFLASGDKDPRKEFIKILKASIADDGTIVAYNDSFEKRILKEVGDAFPEYKKWIDTAIDRMVDLLDPFRGFMYYNPKQKGSASLKEVLPALTGKDYSGMEIAEGGMASLRYLFITHGSFDGKKATQEEVKQVREALEKYCCLDTEGMVWIVDELNKLIK